MVQLSSKNVLILLCFIFCTEIIFAQKQTGDPTRNADYKDPQQHEKFAKRRKLISAWEINQLKDGALVVRLKTNKMAIDELQKAGNTEAALQKELETFAINKNTMFAFLDNFTFCKVYFTYSNFSDSLLRGARRGIFLDTNLRVDPSITLNEKYYMLAERDYGYNSSIGFVPEDSARNVQENGNAVKQMAFVIKNKYGHQLKNPFPHSVAEKNFMNASYDFPINYDNQGGRTNISFYVNKKYLQDLQNEKDRAKVAQARGNMTVHLGKQYTYEKLAAAVQQLNDELLRYHRQTPAPDPSRLPEDIKPFLY